MPNMLFDALFAGLDGRDTAFLHLADGTSISGDAFARMIARFANALVDMKLEPGDRLAAQVAKSPQALALYGAAVAAGVIFLPLNTSYTPDEVDYFVGNSEARLVVGASARAIKLSEIASRHGAAFLTLDGDGSGTFAERAAGLSSSFKPVDREADDIAAFLYTSGTTGRSKGAMMSHDNLLSNARVLVDYWRFGPDDVLLHALPIFHTHGLFVATNVMLLCGGAMIFLPGFDIDEVVRLLPRATTMMGVPTFYTRLLDDPRFDRDLAAHMRLFISGSAPLLAETFAEFERRSGHCILERYGMTETNMNTSNPYDGERRAGTVGFPLPGVEVRITDPATGREVGHGEPGMIEVRGPNVFKGYWKMPDKTNEDLREDGFFTTGDIGQIDADGYVSIVGRQKDLIITGGYNVYPKEIELLLDEQPGVRESAVIGLPHPDFGEAVTGVLVAEEGEDIDIKAVSEALNGRIARFKQPKALFVVRELPRNAMGKVQKNTLRDQYKGHFT